MSMWQDADLEAAQERIAELEAALRGLLAAIKAHDVYLGGDIDDAADLARSVLEE